MLNKLCFLLLAVLLLNTQLLANPVIDSLLYKLESQQGNTKKRVKILNDLAWEYAYLSPVDGMAYANDAKAIADEINDNFGLATSFANLGVLNDISGQYDNALIYYEEAAKIYRSLNNKLSLAGIYNNIGVIHGNLNNPEKAYEFYNKALALELVIDDKVSISDSYINLGVACKNQQKYEEAMYYLRKALKIKQEIGDKSGEMVVIANLGSFYLDRIELDSASKYLYIDLEYELIENDHTGLANAYINLCELESLKGNYEKSIDYGLRAKLLSENIYNYSYLRAALDNLAKAYFNSKDFENAALIQKNIIHLADTVSSKEKKNLIANLESKYQNEIRNGEVVNLRIKNTINEIAIDQEKKEKRLLTILFGLAFMVLIIVLVFYFINRKKNSILREQNIIIQESHEEIENLIKESHHRIKNNLQVVSSMLKLQARSVDNSAAKKALAEAHHRMKTIAIIHQKLYQDDSFKSVNIRNFLLQLIEDFKKGLIGEDLSVTIKAEVDELEMNVDGSIPLGLIINELITNSLKYAFHGKDNGAILVSLKKVDDQLILKVQDNGVGFKEGFNLEENANFGYRVLRSLLRKYKGEIQTYSNNGAHVHITLNKY